jgi:uncharacterized protein YecT (DUF1311 family)
MGPVCAAFSALLVFALIAPAGAETVPASFECAKAGNTVEKFICSQAVLRWQDLALSRAYRAARDAATGSARDDLVVSQRDWVRERNRRCIADRTFKELSEPSTELQEQAYECLKTVYLDRRHTLQDIAAPPLSPNGIREIDLKSIATARPELVENGAVRVAAIHLSPDGALAAILLPSLELDGPDQVWLYRVADGRLAAATPAPDQRQLHRDGSPMAIKATAWQGDTLYARVAEWGGEGESAPQTVYTATVEDSRRLDEVPAAASALLDAGDDVAETGREEMMASDGESPQSVRGNRDFLAWIDDLGHGTIELKTRKRTAGSPADLVAWGGWELAPYLFDENRSQLVYAGDTGITVFDMPTRGERRIAGTSQRDQPYAISAGSGVFVWSTGNACGDEFMTEQDEAAPERLCLARLPKPEGSQ